MAPDSSAHRLFRQAQQRPAQPAYMVKQDGFWKSTSYADYAEEVRTAGRALMALGFAAKQSVCILGFNRPEWSIMDLACMAAGGAPAGIYTTSSPEEVEYIVHHTEAPIVLVENDKQWEKVRVRRDFLPHLRHVVLMKGAAPIDDPMVLSWEAFMAKGSEVAEADLDQRLAALEPGGLATFIYTSGTTGPPKGVMLSHENLTWTADVAAEVTGGSHNGGSLSDLPLSHIAEQVFSIHGPVTLGSTIYFAEAIDKVPDNLKEVQPTLFFGVPRIWEKFQAGISAKLAEATGAKKYILNWARGVGSQVSAL